MSKLGPVVLALALAGASAAGAQDPPWKADEPTGGDYQIGIEDHLQISVWGEPELNMLVFVRPDGKVTFPLVNDIRVAGRSPDQVRQQITERLSTFIRDPNVTVIVAQINSFRVYVLGEVAAQGVRNFNRPTRLLQAVAASGGFTQFSKKQITILRQTEGREERIVINYRKVIAGEPGAENIYLQPGDTLLVD